MIINIKKALKYLENADPRITRLRAEFGDPDFKPNKNYFEALVRAIIFQQLSGKAANTIYLRFKALFKGEQFPLPEAILNIPFETLRAVGLSNQKTNYVRDLSEKIKNGTLKFTEFEGMTDEEVSEALIQVKGIGQWTADMFLMFTLNRPDVFPLGDLGVQKGFMHFCKLKEMPNALKMEQEAEKWRPYRTLVAWYMWKIVDGPFAW
ncbi:MAG: DNA-3-methyladenine glycosylase [Candidatus Neomarinimicrobiota bacterium]